MSPFRERNGDILSRPRPARLSDIHGQSAVVRSLSAFAAAPHSNAFIFAGSSGVGKTAAAWALANELGCDPDWGGVVEIPSGTHARPRGRRPAAAHAPAADGRQRLESRHHQRSRPHDPASRSHVAGPPPVWKRLPAKTVVVFTTNNLHKLTDRFVRRCEVQRFDATSDDFRDGMVDVVRQV